MQPSEGKSCCVSQQPPPWGLPKASAPALRRSAPSSPELCPRRAPLCCCLGEFLFEIARWRCSSQESSRGRGLTWAGVVTSAVGFSVEPRFNLPTRQPDSSAATGRKIEQDPQHRKGQGARQSKSSSAGTARRAGGTTTTPGVLPRLLCGDPRPPALPRVPEGQGLSFHFLTQARASGRQESEVLGRHLSRAMQGRGGCSHQD